jgi:hypothetical protein
MTETPTKDSNLRIVAIALCLSFLFFLRVYRQLLYPAYGWYFEYDIPRLEILATLLCSLSVFGVSCLLLFTIRGRASSTVQRSLQVLFVFVGCMAFGPLSDEILTWSQTERQLWFKYALPVGLLILLLLLVRRKSNRLSWVVDRLGTAVCLVLPVAILTFVQAFFLMTGVTDKNLGSNSVDTGVSRADGDHRLPRVVWIIFDELDFNAFSARPNDIHMPAFEDLMRHSLVAKNAFSPNVSTSVSTLALLSGRSIYWVEPYAPANVKLHFKTSDAPVELTETKTVFDDVSVLSGRSAVAGWNHPYPRLFGDKLIYGYWSPRSIYLCKELNECILSAVGNSFEDLPFVRELLPKNPFVAPSEIKFIRKPFLTYREHLESHEFLLDRAADLVGNPSVDLLFLHLVSPHAPFLTRDNKPGATYFEALESADEALSILRNAMEQAGEWNQSTVIVSSDHWLRSHLHTSGQDIQQKFQLENTRIPFIVKPAGGGAGVQYARPFNTVITRYLINAIMTGEVSTTDDVSSWLDRTATERPELFNFHPCTRMDVAVRLDYRAAINDEVTCK